MSYEEKFPKSRAGKAARSWVEELIEDDGLDKVRKHINVLTENIYQGLPSGDYGRGDVRRTIMALAEVTVKDGKYFWEAQEEEN